MLGEGVGGIEIEHWAKLGKTVMSLLLLNSFLNQIRSVTTQKETIQLSSTVNELTGFYMRRIFALPLL